MPDIETIRDQIHGRLAELDKLMEPLRLEAAQLTKMAETLRGNSGVPSRSARAGTSTPAANPRKTPGKAPRRTSRPASATGAKRGRPLGSGNRAQQAVAKIIEQPGITASELAKSMGISPNYLYRVLPRLEKEAKVTKQGRGYHPSSQAVVRARTNGQPVKA